MAPAATPTTRTFPDPKLFLIAGLLLTPIGATLGVMLTLQALHVTRAHGPIAAHLVAQAALTTLFGLFFLMNYGAVELTVDPAAKRLTHRRAYRFRRAKVTEARFDEVAKVALLGTINVASVSIELKNNASLRIVGGYRNEALRAQCVALVGELSKALGAPAHIDAHLEGWWTTKRDGRAKR